MLSRFSNLNRRARMLLTGVGALALLALVAFGALQLNEEWRANVELALANNLSGAAVGCDNAAFVMDVTVADNTPWAPGQSFNKIWRMRNTGTCAWNHTYQWVFVGGVAMTQNSAISVPVTGPGATADLWIPMVAPTTPGRYIGYWQMRNPSGYLFGAKVWVIIQVISPPQPQPVGCSGAPVISSFTASNSTITPGQSTTLSWGFVGNAERADIDHGIGGVPTPGAINVAPGSTTTYTLTARCGGNVSVAQVTVYVVGVPFGVVGATAFAEPPNYTGKCPTTINLRAVITTNGAGEITYQWESSMGLTSPTSRLNFGGASSQTVTFPLAVGPTTKGTGWARVHVLSPRETYSNQAFATINCQ